MEEQSNKKASDRQKTNNKMADVKLQNCVSS